MTSGWHTDDIRVHTNDIRVHTRDIRMTYEYIQVTYGWHTGTYEWHTNIHEWHTDDIRVHTSDIRVTYEYIWVRYERHDIRMTFEWHTDDMRLEREIKLSFLKLFYNSLSKYLICKRIPCMQLTGINFWCIFSAWFFHTNAPYLILYQSFNVISFLQDIKQNVVLSSYLDNWWRHKL